MENPKMSEAVREKLEEATVAVFMEQYAKALDAGIDKTIEECAEKEFPQELEQRCRALIQQEYAKAQRKKFRKSALRVLRSAAIVAVAVLSLCSVLFMTVEAFRIPVMNFFVEKTDRYWQLSAKPNEDRVFENFNEKNPLDGIIPDGFALKSISGTMKDGSLIAEYSNDNSATIVFFTDDSIGKLQIDDENAVISECKVAGHDARLYIEGDYVRLAWLDEKVSLTFNLCATNVSQEAVTCFAETVADCFD